MTSIIDIDLDTLEPMIACPHSPDNVVKVASLKGTKVDQVCIGSCTNSSLFDMLKVAAMLKGKTIDPSVSLSISPGSKQVLTMLADCGALTDIIASGARILECACGPCIGMGFSPNSGGVSLRTFNRNFLKAAPAPADGQVYLVSPETAVAAALTGYITDPHLLGEMPARHDAGRPSASTTAAVLAPASAEEARTPSRSCGARTSRNSPRASPMDDQLSCPAGAEGGRQHHHRPHHARRRQDPALPLQYPVPVPVLLRVSATGRSRSEPRRPGRRHRRRRQQLRPGLLPGACGAGADVSGRRAVSSPRASPASTRRT